jgi:HK97 family phage major capsid protein/HK97 family phage prohead protease
MKKTLTKKLVHRFVDLIDETSDSQTDQLTFSFSSETPVNRGHYSEVLDHDVNSVDLSRLKNSAPFLFNHDMNKPIGRVVNAWIEDRKGRATIEWGTSDLAQQLRRDTETGILRNISVGYTVEKTEEDEDGNMRAVIWQPHELSLVTVPADTNVGIDRSLLPPTSKPLNERIMPQEQFSPDYLYESKPDEYERAATDFSIVKAMQASVSGNWSEAGKEREIQQELSHRNGRTSQGIFVPHENWKTRDYVKGTATAGGNLVATMQMPDNFVDVLRTKSVALELGATVLPGLIGDVSIPTRTAGATAYFVAESGSVTESTGTFGTISMSPKVMGAYSKFSHLMKLQATPEIEGLIRDDFISTLATKLDSVALNGGGSNEPDGILQTTGIGSVAIGTNGGAITLDKVLDLKQTVAVDNADVANCAFVTNTAVENALSKLKDGNSAYHLNPYAGAVGEQQLANRSFMVTNNVPSNLTKGSSSGVCSAMIYGNFSDLLIGIFGEVEILVDPYSAMQTGVTAVRILQAVDIKVRHAESFGAIQDITT